MAKKAAKKAVKNAAKRARAVPGKNFTDAHVLHFMAVAEAQSVRDCVYNCIRSIAPGANIRDSSILSRMPVPDLTALGRCINGCVPLQGARSWGGGVAIEANWTVEDLIDATNTLKNRA